MTRVESVSISHPRFQSVLARHKAFWHRAPENSFLRSDGVFAPSVPVRLPQANGQTITEAERLLPDMVDPASLIDAVEAWEPRRSDAASIAKEQTLALLGLGDVMPVSQAFFKIPWIEAMLGCPITMTEGQIWVERYEGDLDPLIRRGVRLRGNPWFELYLEFLKQLQARIGDRFPVTANTLLRGPSDLVAALMGVREACVGWVDRPAFMARLMRACTDANLAVIEAGNAQLPAFCEGALSGYGVWSPAPVVRMQADHSSLLSPRMYEEQILPFDLEVIRACPACIFHIHNNGFHVAPFLVQIDELDVIEVVVDPYPIGEAKTRQVEMLQMIQEFKSLILDVGLPSIDEAAWLLGQLSPRGLCYNARFSQEIFRAGSDALPGRAFWALKSDGPVVPS